MEIVQYIECKYTDTEQSLLLKLRKSRKLGTSENQNSAISFCYGLLCLIVKYILCFEYKFKPCSVLSALSLSFPFVFFFFVYYFILSLYGNTVLFVAARNITRYFEVISY